MNRLCKICNITYDISNFKKLKYVTHKCLTCYRKLDNERHKKKYYATINRTEASKKYYALHKLERANYKYFYYRKHRDKILSNIKEYYSLNKDKIVSYQKLYRIKNKTYLSLKKRKYKRLRRKIPSIKLRESVSRSISNSLKKNNESCLKFLPYTILELKIHLENQFEYWMNWNNWKSYSNSWNDNDSETWCWNIDHIISQADLPYTSMEDYNFKTCWSLNNLRPYSAKQNLKDGKRKFLNKI